VKRLWTEDFVTMQASYFKLDGANCTVKPVQKPMLPVWIGANVAVGIRRAARMADAWFINPHNKLDTTAQQMEVYKRALDAAGKPFPAELPMAREVFVAPSRAEAIRLASPYLETKYKAYRAWGQDKVMPASDHFDLDFEDLMQDRFLFGSPAEVTEQILGLRRRFGVTTLIFGIHWAGMPNSLALEQMQLLAEDVFPAVEQAG
jgi:alkanesulfonate monooxygenase SsuD/methylene tetrahydromethanopterin reductase-like flavin-dependent oxidoreductase (luciferase family)